MRRLFLYCRLSIVDFKRLGVCVTAWGYVLRFAIVTIHWIVTSPSATASVLAALHIMRTEPERNAALWDNTNYAMKSFKDLGFEIGHTKSPIIPLFVRNAEKTFVLTHMLFEEGVFVTPVIPPAVPSEDTLIRFALMATHTHQQIDYAVEKIYNCFKKLEIM